MIATEGRMMTTHTQTNEALYNPMMFDGDADKDAGENFFVFRFFSLFYLMMLLVDVTSTFNNMIPVNMLLNIVRFPSHSNKKRERFRGEEIIN